VSDERGDPQDEELIERLHAWRAVEPRPEFSARLLSDVERQLARPAGASWARLRLSLPRMAVAIVLLLALATQQVLAAPASSPLYEARVGLEHLSIVVDPRDKVRETRLAALIRARQAEATQLETAGAHDDAARVQAAALSAVELYVRIAAPPSSQSEPGPTQAPERPEATASPAAAPPAAAPPPQAPIQPAQAVTVSLSGRAVRVGGAPAVDACVRLATQTECATRTGAEGEFRMKVTGQPGSGVALVITLRTPFGLSSAAHVFTLGTAGEQSIGTLTLIP